MLLLLLLLSSTESWIAILDSYRGNRCV